MKLLKYSVLIFIFFCLCCSEKAVDGKYIQMRKEVKLFYETDLNDKEVKQFIFINDIGCPNCILSFSNYVLNNFENYRNNSMIFINSTGKNVDIDKFLQLKSKNVIISRKIRDKAKIIPNLGIIYIKENTKSIDTIISIEPNIIIEQLNYMRDR